jgi:3'-5' exoribonuclease
VRTVLKPVTPEKKIFISRIKEGQTVEDLFLVKDMNRAETRSGKPYLILTLMDRTGEIPARLWENADAFLEACEPGNLVQVSGQAQVYRGILQLKIDHVVQAEKKEPDKKLFLQASKKDTAAMAKEITAMAHSVKDPFYRKLLLKFFRDSPFFDDFQQAPAAKLMHHAYLGGLLEHTTAIAKLADMVAGFYPALDRDLLLTGALLHDIGKTRELAFEAFPFEYTVRGRLLGHLVIGVEMIREQIRTIADFPEDLATRLLHLILSHHGRYEFGSPSLPMISEAFVLNFLDDLDAKLNFLERLEEQAPEPGYQWSEFQRTLERFLYIKGRPHADAGNPESRGPQEAEERTETNSRQQNLF